jgi:hypothetical protein
MFRAPGSNRPAAMVEVLERRSLCSATISGTVFNDSDGNALQSSIEHGLSGWGVYLDLNANSVRDAGEPQAIADSAGHYSFSNVAPGTYRVGQTTPALWKRTVPSTQYAVSVAAEQQVTGKNFGNKPIQSIAGVMFSDHNGDGLRQAGEEALVGWGCYLDLNNNGVFDGNDRRAFTDSNGIYQFTDIAAGTYHIRQNTPSGWRRTLPVSLPYTIKVAAGQTVTGKNFGEQQLASISGVMFEDVNGTAKFDDGDFMLSGWGCFIDYNNDGVFDTGVDVRVYSDADGHYSFTNLVPGTYHIAQRLPLGWRRTLGGPFTITLTAGQNATGKDFAVQQTTG